MSAPEEFIAAATASLSNEGTAESAQWAVLAPFVDRDLRLCKGWILSATAAVQI